MLIIAVSGRKQSGKSTAGNLIYALFMAQLGICEQIRLDADGKIWISDLLGQNAYEGIFNPQYISNNTNDININKVFDILNPKIQIYNFADMLKQNICMGVLGLTYDQCYGSDEDKNIITNYSIDGKLASSRDLMQYIGTDVFRKMHPDIWVNATIQKIKKDNPEIAIITDCRFPNEVDIIKSNQGKVIRLTRDPFQSDHISENILDRTNYDWSNFDYIIDNTNYSLYEQSVEIKRVIEEILQLS